MFDSEDISVIQSKVIDKVNSLNKAEYAYIIDAICILTNNNEYGTWFLLKEIQEHINTEFVKYSSPSYLANKKLNNYLNVLLGKGILERTIAEKNRAGLWRFSIGFLEETFDTKSVNTEPVSISGVPAGEQILLPGGPKPCVAFKDLKFTEDSTITNVDERVDSLYTNLDNTLNGIVIPDKAIEPKNPAVLTTVAVAEVPVIMQVEALKERQAKEALNPHFNKLPFDVKNLAQPKKSKTAYSPFHKQQVQIPYFCCYKLSKKDKSGALKHRTFSNIFLYPEEFFYEDDAFSMVEGDILDKHPTIEVSEVLILTLNPLVIV
jgi:hypothetical protein